MEIPITSESHLSYCRSVHASYALCCTKMAVTTVFFILRMVAFFALALNLSFSLGKPHILERWIQRTLD